MSQHGVTHKMAHLKELLISEKLLNLNTPNFHLEDVKKASTTGIIQYLINKNQ